MPLSKLSPSDMLRFARPPFRTGNAFLDSRKMNIVIPDGEEEAAENFALGTLPAQEERIFSEHLGMLCQGEWQPRFLVLDAAFASISLVGSDDILDKIPLVQFQFVLIYMSVLTIATFAA